MNYLHIPTPPSSTMRLRELVERNEREIILKAFIGCGQETLPIIIRQYWATYPELAVKIANCVSFADKLHALTTQGKLGDDHIGMVPLPQREISLQANGIANITISTQECSPTLQFSGPDFSLLMQVVSPSEPNVNAPELLYIEATDGRQQITDSYALFSPEQN